MDLWKSVLPAWADSDSAGNLIHPFVLIVIIRSHHPSSPANVSVRYFIQPFQ